MTAKSGNSFLMDEILIWITLAVSIILLISNFGVAGFLGDAVSGVLWEIIGAVAYIIPFCLVWYLFWCLIKATGMHT